MIDFSSVHFKKFQSIELPDQSHWAGHQPKEWFQWFSHALVEKGIITAEQHRILLEQTPQKKLTRQDLINLVSKQETPIEVCVIAISAWGGMKRQHGASLFNALGNWIHIAEKIRNGSIDRLEAFRNFSELRAAGKLPGMGPAYFTKLIFFLVPAQSSRGYIMDQWTASSVNLLHNMKIVITNVAHEKNKKSGKIKIVETVSDKNSENNYKLFCETIEAIAKNLKCSPHTVEERMFSAGRGRGEWRNYINSERRKAPNEK